MKRNNETSDDTSELYSAYEVNEIPAHNLEDRVAFEHT